MDKFNKQMAHEIRTGVNAEQNLPMLMSRMASAYGQLSFYNLAMELSMFLDSINEERIKPDKMVKDFYDSIKSVLEELLGTGYDPEKHQEMLEQMVSLRDMVTERMEILTAYTDTFVLYEYVINRLEPKFLDTNYSKVDNDAVAREILQWIFSDEERSLVNERIKLMLAHLPVRMTKGKLTELVQNAFSLYKEADAQSIDTFDYMLRSATGLYQPKGMAKAFPKLYKVRKLFEEKDFSEISKEDYMECRKQLQENSQLIHNLADCLESIQTIMNALLTVLLTKPYFTLEAERSSKQASDIIRNILENKADAESLFAGIENEMEVLSQEVNTLEPLFAFVTETAEQKLSELMLTTVYRRLKMVQRLNSGSTYASLNENIAKETPTNYVEKCCNQFIQDLTVSLSQGSKLQNRAYMAAVLSELPVYFNNRTEVMNYVRSTLENCHDESEKVIGVELLRSCY